MGRAKRVRDRIDHHWSQRRLSEYLEDSLAVRDRRRLDGHLARCPECRRVLRTLLALVLGLRGLRATGHRQVGEEIVERVRREPGEELGSPGRR